MTLDVSFELNELKKVNLDLKDATAAVFVERFTGLFTLLILAMILSLPGINMFASLEMDWLQTPFLISVLVLFIGVIIGYRIWQNFLKPYLKQREAHVIWGKIFMR